MVATGVDGVGPSVSKTGWPIKGAEGGSQAIHVKGSGEGGKWGGPFFAKNSSYFRKIASTWGSVPQSKKSDTSQEKAPKRKLLKKELSITLEKHQVI